MRAYLKIILIIALILVVILYFGFSFLSRYGDKDLEAMSDHLIEQYVKERIPINSSESAVKAFIEEEKEKFPYYSTPSFSCSCYVLQYTKGSYELWIGGYNYCRIFVYLDEENKVSEIKLRRTTGPYL